MKFEKFGCSLAIRFASVNSKNYHRQFPMSMISSARFEAIPFDFITLKAVLCSRLHSLLCQLTAC